MLFNHMFREQDRLKEDPRMLRIHDPSDFALYQRHKELGFKGMVYDYSLNEHFKAANLLQIPQGRQAEFETVFLTGTIEDEQGLSYMQRKLAQDDFPEPYWPVAIDLFSYKEIAQINTNRCSDITLRFNTHYPQYAISPDHAHDAILTLSVKGHSSVLQNEEGGFYKTRNGDVTLIGDGMLHWAPEKDPNQPVRAVLAVN